MTFTTSGVRVRKILVETPTKTDVRTLRQTLTEHLVLIFTLLTRSKLITRAKKDKKGYKNTIRRATDALSKYRYTNEFTNKNKFTKRFSNNITDKFT